MFSDVYLVSKNLRLAEPASLRKIEATIRSLPAGYEEFVTELGEGLYSGFIRIYMPKRIATATKEARDRWDDFFNWKEGKLSRREVLQSFIVGDTVGGDELIHHPDHPRSMFILPRHHDAVVEVRGGVRDVIDWICTSKKLTAPIHFRYFESGVARDKIELYGSVSFAAFKKAMLASGLVTHVGEEERKEHYILMFFEPGGSLAYFGTSKIVVVEVDRDRKEDAADLIAFLRSLGFGTKKEFAAQQKAKLVIVKSADEADPEQTVVELMKAMRILEKGGTGDWGTYIETATTIVAKFFVAGTRSFRSSQVSCYDPKANVIVSTETHGKSATVVTERKLKDGVIRMEYHLAHGPDGWRVARTELEGPTSTTEQLL